MKSNELKLEARTKLTNKWAKVFSISLFYTALIIAVDYITKYISEAFLEINYISSFFNLLFLIFILPLSFGVTASIIKLMRNDNVSITDFINIGFKNIYNTWKVVFSIFLKLLLPFIIFILVLLAIAYCIISITSTTLTFDLLYLLILIFAFVITIFSLIIVLPYSLSMFVLFDNLDKKGSEIINISKDLMGNNKLKYVFLLLSFIGWFILFAIIVSISNHYFPSKITTILSYAQSILLVPYITAAEIAFYENLKGAKKEEIENIVEPENMDVSTE